MEDVGEADAGGIFKILIHTLPTDAPALGLANAVAYPNEKRQSLNVLMDQLVRMFSMESLHRLGLLEVPKLGEVGFAENPAYRD